MPVLPVPEALQALGRQAAGRDAPAQGAAASRPAAAPAAPQAGAAQSRLDEALALLRASAPALEFVVDDGRAIVRVVDRETGELLRQIPAPEVIAAGQAIEQLQGLLLRSKA